jgi:uncharacterized protein YkwD
MRRTITMSGLTIRFNKITALFLTILCMLSLCAIARPGLAAPARAPIDEGDPAETVLQLINEWRVQEGLWPLRVNTALQTMALAQAEYIQPRISSITDYDGYHKDAQGRFPPERARQDYDWPLIGGASAAASIRIGENAAVGTPKFAMNFWKGSDIHRRAALSNLYHDVGVAAVPYKTGYVFIVNFGARPDGIAILANLRGDKLYIGNDCLCGQRGEIKGTKMRLFNAKGAPITDTMDWKPIVDVDEKWGKNLMVLYTNGTRQQFVSVEIGKDIAILPRSASVVIVAPQPTVTPSPVPVVFQTSPTPGASPTIGSGTRIAAATPTYTPIFVVPTTAPTETPSPTPIPTQASAPPDLILTYSNDNLILFNNSKKTLNLTGLAVGGATGRVSIATWKTIATFPDNAFPAAHCLQITTGTGTLRNDCRFVRSSVTVSAARAFWREGTFRVTQNDLPLAECDAKAQRCEVWLKGK